MTASEYPGSPSLYPILDLDFCNKNGILPDSLIKIWSQETLTVPFIQVRAKSLNVKDFTAFYRQLKEQNPGARLIVNDHWEVAIKENAFGFHVGKEDFQFLPDEERKIIGSSPLFKGTSSHNLEDIKNLDSEIWNYSGIGPIFQTSTKVTKNKI
ncbi:MAG: thiamine phosphate synthase, partial [Leptospira sp.]|nr:thiamine phosphate synthase [Leptospira sp.]